MEDTDKKTDLQIDRQKDDGHSDKLIGNQTKRYKNGWMEDTDRKTDIWIERRTDTQTNWSVIIQKN